MSFNKYFLYILILGLFSSCSARFKAGSEVDPNVDFKNYQSFSQDRRNLFTKRSNPILNSELTKRLVNQAIISELRAKGYEQNNQSPDLIFNFQTAIRSRQDVQFNNNFPVWSYSYRFYNPAFDQPQVRDYEETTLIIDVLDAKTNQLIWQGWVVGEMDYTSDRFQRQINTTIAKALEKFPTKNAAQ